jgi:hypothetical protein
MAADAGPDLDVTTGDAVTLDGGHSIDLDHGNLTYVWAQVAGPCVNLTEVHKQKVSFTAPPVSDGHRVLTFRLVVGTGGGHWSNPDTADVTVADD